MSQNNQNPQRQQSQQPSQQSQQDKPQPTGQQQQPASDPAPKQPTERETMQAKKDKIQDALLKFVRNSPNASAQLRADLTIVDLFDVRLVPRGLMLSLLNRSSFEVKEVPILTGENDKALMPKDAAEAIAREWKAINESGALRS